MDSPFEIDEIWANFPRGISTSNWWPVDEDVSIKLKETKLKGQLKVLHLILGDECKQID